MSDFPGVSNLRTSLSAFLVCVLSATLALSTVSAQSEDDYDDWEEDSWEEEADHTPKSFLYKEVVLSGLYSIQGMTGIPPGDDSVDHFALSPRPPGNYIALDWVVTVPTASCLNRSLFPSWLPMTAMNLHPRLALDRMEPGSDVGKLRFAPQDFWIRFNPGQADRFSIRLGQFVIPYGVNPILAPRQRFILPIEATDLGLKWDWGIGLKGPIGNHDWELAGTIGSGETINAPNLFDNSDSTSWLVTGRVGTPVYWDLQYGLSFLYGDLRFIRAAHVFSSKSISRWRLGLDGFYRFGTWLMAGAQLTYGQDGFAGDEEFVMITMGKTADVLGYRIMVDWVPPEEINWRAAAQFESVNRDLYTEGTSDTALILEVSYSVSTSFSLMLDHRVEFSRSMGRENDAIYLTAIYYAR